MRFLGQDGIITAIDKYQKTWIKIISLHRLLLQLLKLYNFVLDQFSNHLIPYFNEDDEFSFCRL